MIQELELIGNRVKLVPLRSSHVEDLFHAGREEIIWTYLPLKVSSLEDMKKLVEEALEQKARGQQFPFVVIDLSTNEIVGSTRYLNIMLSNRNMEIGWTWYSPQVWRTHVNTECKYLLLKHCFEELNLVRVQLKADVRNERSNKAILRIGAKHEGVLRKDRILHDGYIRDSNLYSIIAEEWPEVKARFEQQLLR